MFDNRMKVVKTEKQVGLLNSNERLIRLQNSKFYSNA